MVKIGMLLPEERMVEPARKIIEENHLDVVYLEAVHTVDAVNKARIAVEAGAPYSGCQRISGEVN